jgi:hypothetical protein
MKKATIGSGAQQSRVFDRQSGSTADAVSLCRSGGRRFPDEEATQPMQLRETGTMKPLFRPRGTVPLDWRVGAVTADTIVKGL